MQGEIEFKSLLFIPGMAPFNTEDMLSGKTKNIRLYVKRVFISDEFDGELVSRHHCGFFYCCKRVILQLKGTFGWGFACKALHVW